MSTKLFSGETEVKVIDSMPNALFARMFPGVRGVKHDGFSMRIGYAAQPKWQDQLQFVGALPVDRAITYKSQPSLHQCGPKCREAKGNLCECECGGKFHGIDK